MAFSNQGPSYVPGRRRVRAGGGPLSEMNIVPLVDVVLVLLIVFMLTAHVMEFGLEINVPQVKDTRDTTEDLPIVHVFPGGKIYLGDKPANINSLVPEIHEKYKDAKSVFVRADEKTIWGPVAQVISVLSKGQLGVKVVTKTEEK